MFGNLPYNKPLLIEDKYFYENINQKLYLEKSFFKSNLKDQYFLKLYLYLPNGDSICQGYIYFYLDIDNKESQFIGAYIKDEYRNKGLASLLISNWIKLCLDNDVYKLSTSKKQRKPFLLYLLKTYYFELSNKNLYNEFNSVISICESPNDSNKYLLFKNPIQKEHFLNSSIMKEDNYLVLNEVTDDIKEIEQVILSKIYFLQNENEAFKKSLKYIETKKDY